ncbi:hypothetical protein PG997_009461 [Apiospora hydei]|uniref:Uncharacterized protein n=1 Tax=Apiospora hydei TaxID=1337664 RepID=A0ABR1VU73_9PEZI
MQFVKSILFIAFIMGVAHAAALAEDDIKSRRPTGAYIWHFKTPVAKSHVMKRKSDAGLGLAAMNLPLEKRACTGSCKCVRGSPPGLYCGMCSQVLSSETGLDGQIFQCNPEGGCCSWGKSSRCAGSDAQGGTHCPE